MNFKLSVWTKVFLVVICGIVSIVGFMIKLPPVFRHYDKEMHTLFYFLAAAFLNILFAKRNILIHAGIFFILLASGIAIEYAQEYSNKLLHKKIHGRFDIEDVHANVKGLVAFSVLWVVCVIIQVIYRQVKSKPTVK